MTSLYRCGNAQLCRWMSLVICISATLPVLYCLHLYGNSPNEWILTSQSNHPFTLQDREEKPGEEESYAGGEEVKGSGEDVLNSVASMGGVQAGSQSLKGWLDRLQRGSSWERGSFCDSYFGHPFSRSVEVRERVLCRGAERSDRMAVCTIRGLGLLPRSTQRKKKTGFVRDLADSVTFWLTRDAGEANIIPCPQADLSALNDIMEQDDYARTIVRSTVLGTPIQEECQRLFTGTTFFFMGMERHIYFMFLAWYNLFKTLLDNSDVTNGTMKYHIVRFPEGWETFHLIKFEQRLFPEVIPLNLDQKEVNCFEKVVLSPWAYAAAPFRCRMDKDVKSRCSACNGQGLATDLKLFRWRVLDACGLPPSREKNMKRNVVVIKRKAYIRNQEDNLRTFKRVWKNADEFVMSLSEQIPDISVTGIYAEDLAICKQIKLAYQADILVGLHGAGLVHLWWMEEGSHLVEFMPSFEVGNIAFEVLSKLLGINMHSMQFHASARKPIPVPVDRAINEIRKVLQD